MRPSDLAIILTARTSSERLPGKVIADVSGLPLISWIIRRLKPIGTVVLATSTDKCDGILLDIAQSEGVYSYAGSKDDVVTRIDSAIRQFTPDAKYVLRALGDCPFMATDIIEHAVYIMNKYKTEAFAWASAPFVWPVYGAREFPYSRDGWNRINAQSTNREHPDMAFHNNRSRFRISYHEIPPSTYYRSYRLEVDWQEDLDLIRAISSGPGMLAPTLDVVRFLDNNPGIASINRSRVERTGPSCYDYKTQRAWYDSMAGKPIIRWDGDMWRPPSRCKTTPVFCDSGLHLLGFADNKGTLYTPNAWITGDAYLQCECSVGKRWIGKAE